MAPVTQKAATSRCFTWRRILPATTAPGTEGGAGAFPVRGGHGRHYTKNSVEPADGLAVTSVTKPCSAFFPSRLRRNGSSHLSAPPPRRDDAGRWRQQCPVRMHDCVPTGKLRCDG